ncbi:hypothetical protein D9619_011396 [Psilocybe cf. subviscida]|uniref:Uncharacterized protein n=1 Tax=Psilocybe cf. subviscida TaxID=2480587 RepID=A0A8H5BLG3_9AGAR|nr:hypothetical protein D9619_011396 [Psilocybe cf. subviscida]
MLPQKNVSGQYNTNELIAFTEAIQRERRNLVVYSRLAEAVVEVAWPLKADGTLIVATGLKDWLRARGLFIECFCPLMFEITDREPCSCRIVVSLGGDVFAFCNKDTLVSGEGGCKMNVNLSQKLRDGVRNGARYDHFKTTKGSRIEYEPVMKHIYDVYQTSSVDTRVPLLNGYIGEHVAAYREGSQQLAGSMGTVWHAPIARKPSENYLRPLYHGRPYNEVVLPKTVPKARYIEIDHEHHAPITMPTALERAQLRLGDPVDGKSSALTRVRRKVPKAQTYAAPPTAGTSKLKKPTIVIDISSSDEAEDIHHVSQKPMAKGKKRAAGSGFLERLQADEGLTRSEIINLLSGPLLCMAKRSFT